MATLSIGKAWAETSAFVAREAALLVPVALLFISVPLALLFQLIPADVRARMMTPRPATGAETVPTEMLLVMLATMVVVLTGGVALYVLSLRPGVSVAESLQRAVRRAPVVLGTQLLMGLALALVVILLGATFPVAATGVMIVAFALYYVRLMPLNALIADRDIGVFASIRESWALTRGHFVRLALVWMVMMALLMLAMVVAQAISGIIGFAIGGREGLKSGGDIGAAIVLGLSQIYLTAMAARLYRQLEDKAA